MAGWSKLEYESSMHCCKKVSNRIDLNDCLGDEKSKVQIAFVGLISDFIEETCPSNSYRPLPPMLGNGHSVDLLKLYFVVRQKGGFDSISKNGLWDEVGLVYGLGPGFGSSMKLIYLKYLESLESWLVKLHKDKNSTLMELETDYNSFVSKISDEMRKNDKYYVMRMEKSDISFVGSSNDDDDDSEKFKREKIEMNFSEVVDLSEEDDGDMKFKRKKIGLSLANDGELTEENSENVKSWKKMKSLGNWGLETVSSKTSFAYDNSLTVSDSRRSSVGEDVVDNVVKSSENSDASMKCSKDLEGDFISVDSSVLKEEVSVHKTRQDSLLRMVHWMANVAKDPTDPEVGMIPESSKWANFGNENRWKQVLLAREAIFRKRDQASSTVLSVWQKKQRMHPSMFDDQLEATETPRSSPRLLFVNVPKSYSTSLRTSHDNDMNRGRSRQRLDARLDLQPRASIYTSRPQQRIPVGEHFQAEVPEWTGVPAESDPKWLGTQVWPLNKSKRSLLIERDSIGKGRVDNCGCPSPGSTDCVKFHVAERRTRMKVELGSAFYVWNIHKMGEACSVSWTTEEEKKFNNVVKENPLSLHKFFWPEMSKVLPRKSWTDLVNYYFNVFVLRRRGSQNRHVVHNIDSDDDETQYRVASNCLGSQTPKSFVSNSSSKKVH